jgi:hypothetical protein
VVVVGVLVVVAVEVGGAAVGVWVAVEVGTEHGGSAIGPAVVREAGHEPGAGVSMKVTASLPLLLGGVPEVYEQTPPGQLDISAHSSRVPLLLRRSILTESPATNPCTEIDAVQPFPRSQAVALLATRPWPAQGVDVALGVRVTPGLGVSVWVGDAGRGVSVGIVTGVLVGEGTGGVGQVPAPAT